MAHSSRHIMITRRSLAAALLASGALGIGIGELAAPLAASQAHARTASAPAACGTFAKSVGNAFQTLGTILVDASKYPPLISKAYAAGTSHSSSQYAAVTRKRLAINSLITTQSAKFNKIKGPLLSQERQCLS